MKHINIIHLIAAALAALFLICAAHNITLRNELAAAHMEVEELSDPTVFRVDMLHNILSRSYGEEFADMMVRIIRTHPDNGETFTPLWDEDLIDRGIMPLGWEG